MQKAKIVVAVRKRPLFEKERAKGYNDIVQVNGNTQVVVSEMKQKVDLTKYLEDSVFNFDYAFGQQSSNEEIYDYIISPLIDSAFEGAKVSCFAYGQTGSGKTHTMNGVMSKNMPGLYTLGAIDIFGRLQQEEFCHLSAYLSFYEIYCTKLYDLLNKRSELVLREDGKSNINVVGLSEIPVSTVEQFENHLKIGSSQRVTSQNSANSQSSRSHAILQITLKNGKKTFGKVYFIDLAGNQRGADHMNMKKQTQKDGQQINKSLLQLKQCIRGLDQGKNHVPFRGSKLTMCLKDSFIGFCRTVMIGNLSPSSSSSQNTLNTLRYADRVKELKNSEDLSKQELKSRQMMLPRQNKNAIKIAISNSDDQEDIAEKKKKALDNYGMKVQEHNPSNVKPRISSSAKDEPVARKHSMGAPLLRNNISQVQQQQPVKGNSLAKNGLNNEASTRRNEPVKKVNIGSKREQNDYANKNGLNLNLSQHSQNMQSSIQQRFKDEPHSHMGGERSAGSSMDMRKGNTYMRSGNGNNVNGNLTSRSNNAGNGLLTHQRDYQGVNNIGNVPSSNLDYGIGTSQSQVVNNGSRAGLNNNGNNLPNAYGRGNSSSQHVGNMGNYQQQNQQYPQQQYRQPEPVSPMPKNPLHKANNFFSSQQTNPNGNNSLLHQSPSTVNGMNSYYNGQQQSAHNMGQKYPNNHQSPYPQQPQQQYQTLSHPQSWNELVEAIDSPDLNSQAREEYHMLLNGNLLQSQNQLISLHSSTLQSQIQKIKEEMQTIKIIQEDKSQITSKQYAQLMYESIDEKMSQLQMLKQTLTTFMYKLDDMEEVQRKVQVINASSKSKAYEDEQLLDDF